MTEAALLGGLAASSLAVGALLALWLRPSHRVIGSVLAFGAGALISAIAYELVLDALQRPGASFSALAVSLFIGALAFDLGDLVIARRGGGNRKRMARTEGEGEPLALLLGALLDGIPESFIIGLTIATGGEAGIAFLAAVFVSNLPEVMASTSGFRNAGWPAGKIAGLWLSVVALSAVVAAIGFAAADRITTVTGVYAQGFAAGSLLTMLTDTMLPEALRESGKTAGLWTVLGFSVAVALSALQ